VIHGLPRRSYEFARHNQAICSRAPKGYVRYRETMVGFAPTVQLGGRVVAARRGSQRWFRISRRRIGGSGWSGWPQDARSQSLAVVADSPGDSITVLFRQHVAPARAERRLRPCFAGVASYDAYCRARGRDSISGPLSGIRSNSDDSIRGVLARLEGPLQK